MWWTPECSRCRLKATSIDKVKDVRDKAEAVRLYTKQRVGCFDVFQQAGDIKVRAERKIGELVPRVAYDRGNNTSQPGSCKLADLGLTHNDSSRYQRIAAIPEDVFERTMQEQHEKRREITSTYFQKLGKKHTDEEQQERRTNGETCTTDDLHKLVKAGKTYGTVYADPPWAIP